MGERQERLSPPPVKPVTVDGKTTALLLLDFLPSYYCSDDPRCVATLPAMKKLLGEARAHGATVVYSIAGKFTAADIAKDVAPQSGEPVVKSHADKFLHTDLEKILKDKGIQTVIVTGTSANRRRTLHRERCGAARDEGDHSG